MFFGPIAQLVERLNGIEEANGSNPFGSTSEQPFSLRVFLRKACGTHSSFQDVPPLPQKIRICWGPLFSLRVIYHIPKKLRRSICGCIAQLVEQLPLKETVGGSNPSAPTSEQPFSLRVFLRKACGTHSSFQDVPPLPLKVGTFRGPLDAYMYSSFSPQNRNLLGALQKHRHISHIYYMHP